MAQVAPGFDVIGSERAILRPTSHRRHNWSATSRAAAQSYGTVTENIPIPNSESFEYVTTPVRENEADSFTLGVTASGGFSDDSLGASLSGQANVHTENGHVSRTEITGNRSTSFAGLAGPIDGLPGQIQPVWIEAEMEAFDLEKDTFSRVYREDYDYSDTGAGLTRRGTFSDTPVHTTETRRSIPNVSLDGLAENTTGTYTARQDGGTRANDATIGSFVDGVGAASGTGPAGGRTVDSTGTNSLTNFAANTATIKTTTNDANGNRSGSVSTSGSKSRSNSQGDGSSQVDGATPSGASGNGTFDGLGRATSQCNSYEIAYAPAATVSGVTTTTRSASTASGDERGENTMAGGSQSQTQDGGRGDSADFNSTDSGRSKGSGASMTAVKEVAGDTITFIITAAHGGDHGKSDGTGGGTSDVKSGATTAFKVTDNDTSEGGGDSSVTRTTITLAPDSASRETVKTTQSDTGKLTNDGKAKLADGATSRNGEYTLVQAGTNGVELDSVSNSKGSDGTLHFGTLHGTLKNGAIAGGNGDYVSAAGSATSQSGDVNSGSGAKLGVKGVEGTFKRDPIMTNGVKTGESWSGTLITSSDDGNSAGTQGGHITIDPAGHVTATNITGTENGGGTRTTESYIYSGSYDTSDVDNITTVHLSADRRLDTYTITTSNTPAKDNTPASTSSTETHGWVGDSLDATIATADNGDYGWAGESEGHKAQEKGTQSQTVGLSGPAGSQRASAKISSKSQSVDKDFHTDVNHILSPSHPDHFENIETTNIKQNEKKTDSNYTSNHTVDSQGRAYGGTFSASSNSRETTGTLTLYHNQTYWGPNDPAQEGNVDEQEDRRTENSTTVISDSAERGSYYDLTASIRLQSGTYHQEDTTIKTDREDVNTLNTSALGLTYPYLTITSDTLNRTDELTRTTTDGSYNPYGSSESQKIAHDLVQRDNTNGTLRNVEGTWQDTHSRHDLDIHTQGGVTTGHEYSRHWTVDDDGETNIGGPPIDRDLFENNPPPATPVDPNPIAKSPSATDSLILPVADVTPPKQPLKTDGLANTSNLAPAVRPPRREEYQGYWHGVGQVFKGYGDAVLGAVKGAAYVVTHPGQVKLQIGRALQHPLETGEAIYDDVREKASTTRGLGELVGDFLTSVATGGALKAAKESAAFAKIASKLDELGISTRTGHVANKYAKPKVITPKPVSPSASISAKQLEKKWKHAVDFGITTTKRNAATLNKYRKAIADHLIDASTIAKGTYGYVADSKVYFNPKTNLAVVLDKAGNYVTGFRLAPGTPQFENFINGGILR